MRRREFLRNVLGGAAGAVVGAAVPASLRAEEMRLLEERVDLEWVDGQLVVRNLRRETVEVTASQTGRVSADWGTFQPSGLEVRVTNLTGERLEFRADVGPNWVSVGRTPDDRRKWAWAY